MTKADALSWLSDAQLMALTMRAEAEGDGIAGMVAVGQVIMHRLRDEDRRWGKTVYDVCLRPKQFSCWNPGPTREWLEGSAALFREGQPTDEAPRTQQALWLADGVLHDKLVDTVAMANHYYAPKAMKPPGMMPSWAMGRTSVAKVVGHLFYRL